MFIVVSYPKSAFTLRTLICSVIQSVVRYPYVTDYVTKVLPIDVGRILFGRPWIHSVRAREVPEKEYCVLDNGKSILLRSEKPQTSDRKTIRFASQVPIKQTLPILS